MGLGLLEPIESSATAPTRLDQAGQPEPVGVPRRAVARLIDFALAWTAMAIGLAVAVLAVLAIAAPGNVTLLAAIERVTETEKPTLLVRLFETLLGVVGLTLQHTLAEGLHGSTIGKRLLGITVLSEYGNPAGLRRALRRSLGFLVDQLVFGLVGVHRMLNSDHAQRVGDEWAGTVVRRIRDVPPAQRRPAWRFVAGTLAGLAAAFVAGVFVTCLQIGAVAARVAEDRVQVRAAGPTDTRSGPAGRLLLRQTLRIDHRLRSAPLGRLHVALLVDGEPAAEPHETSVTEGSSTSSVVFTFELPRPTKGSSAADVQVVAELRPAPNREVPTAVDVLYLDEPPSRP